MKGLHKEDVSEVGGIVEAELFLTHCHLRELEILLLILSFLASVCLQVLDDCRVLRVVQRGGAPPVPRARIAAGLDKILDDVDVPSCRSEMERGTEIVVSLV